jgi:dihydrofolate reductase
MAKLIYSAITSLDGYVADADGNFDWAVPDDEVHGFVNALERPIGTYLYGRRMYAVMSAWETVQAEPFSRTQEFADLWRSADKIVYSTSLPAVATARTSLERRFEPEAVRRLKAAAERDLSVGGPELAAQALRYGLVDECHLYLNPVVVGGGTPALPDHVRFGLALLDEYRFGNGVVHLHYRLVSDHPAA